MPNYPRFVYGMDFSADQERAGWKIWLARGTVDNGLLRIDDCRPAAELLPGSPRQRDQALSALTECIAGATDCVFGLDFPFGLPKQLLQEEESWEDFILSFPKRFASPEEFSRHCHERTDGKEPRRLTDRKNKTPMSPINRWLFRQTFHGIRDVLRPLVQARSACVLPMQHPHMSSRRPWVLEICPASTLKCEPFFYDASGKKLQYKESSKNRHKAEELYRNRASILQGFEKKGCLFISRQNMRREILDNPGGDALDSIIAAIATFRNGVLNRNDLIPSDNPLAMREGYVYV